MWLEKKFCHSILYFRIFTFLAKSRVSSLPVSALFFTRSANLVTCSDISSFSSSCSSFSASRVSSCKELNCVIIAAVTTWLLQQSQPDYCTSHNLIHRQPSQLTSWIGLSGKLFTSADAQLLTSNSKPILTIIYLYWYSVVVNTCTSKV